MPIVAAAEDREAILVELAEGLAVDPHRARGRALDAADHREQGRLARARRPDHADRAAGGDLEIDAAQDLDGAGGAAQGHVHVAELDHRRGAGWGRSGEGRGGRGRGHGGTDGPMGARFSSSALAIALMIAARQARARGRRLPDRRARRFPGLEPTASTSRRAFRRGSSGGSPRRATTARCSMPGSPATPRPAASRGSTGCSPTSRAT